MSDPIIDAATSLPSGDVRGQAVTMPGVPQWKPAPLPAVTPDTRFQTEEDSTDDLRQRYAQVLEDSDKPVADAERFDLGDELARRYGMDPVWARSHVDYLAQQMLGKDDVGSFGDQLARSWDLGAKQVDMANRMTALAPSLLSRNADPKALADAKKLYDETSMDDTGSMPLAQYFLRLKGQLMAAGQSGPTGWLKGLWDTVEQAGGEALKGTFRQAPGLFWTLGGGAAGAAAGAGIGAAAGAVAGGVGAAPGAATGAVTGFGWGVGTSSAQQEAGQMLADLMFNPDTEGKIDPAAAVMYSGLYGVVAGALDKVGLDKMPGLKTVLDQARAKTAAALMTKGTLRDAFTKNAAALGKDFAIGWGTEAWTEAAQQGAQDILTEAAKQYSEALGAEGMPRASVQSVVQDMVESGWQAALAYPVLGAAGLGFELTQHSRETVQRWQEQGVADENMQTVNQSILAASQIERAKPVQPEEIPPDGITVYMAGAQDNLDSLGTDGLRLYTNPDDAEAAARDSLDGPLDQTKLLAGIDRQFPHEVGELARAVLKDGPEAAAPFLTAGSAVEQWAQGSDGEYDAKDIVALADAVRTGQDTSGRNELALHYGLADALPMPQITEARILPGETAEAANRSEIAGLFQAGNKAVKFGGHWYVRSADAVRKVGQYDSRAASASHHPVGDYTVEDTGTALRALGADGSELGRLDYIAEPTGPRIGSLTVEPQYRRQGVASELVRQLQARNAGGVVSWPSDLTDEGRALTESVRRQSPGYQRWAGPLARAEKDGNEQLAAYYRARLDKVAGPDTTTSELTGDELRRVLMTGTTMSAGEIEATMDAVERMASSAGLSTDAFLGRSLARVETAVRIDAGKNADGTDRVVNGAVLITAAGKRVIQLAAGRAEASTVLHELFHALRPLLSAEDQQTLLDWTGESSWTTKAEEMAARGFESRIMERQSLGDKIDAVLDKLRWYFRAIYEAFVGNPVLTASDDQGGRHAVVLTDQARAVFDRVLDGAPPRAEIAAVGAVSAAENTTDVAAQDASHPIYQDRAAADKEQQDPLKPVPTDVQRVEKQLDILTGDGFKGTMDFGPTPPALRSFGLNAGPLIVDADKIAAVMLPEGEKTARGWNGHGMRKEDILAGWRGLYDPAFAFTSRKANELQQTVDRVVVVTGAFDAKGNPIVAVMDRAKRYREDVTRIVSIYGMSNAASKELGLQFDVNRGAVVYRQEKNKDAVSSVIRIKWPATGNGVLEDNVATRSDAVNGNFRTLFQDASDEKLEADLLNIAVFQAKEELKARTEKNGKTRERRINEQLKSMTGGATDENRAELGRQFDRETERLRAAIAANEVKLKALQEHLATVPSRTDQEKEAARQALAAGQVVPSATLRQYDTEAWAREELDRRAQWRDAMDESLKYGSMEDWIEAVTDEHATAGGWDPFGKESRPPLSPAQDKVSREVFTAARMKTPAEFDREWVSGLNERRVIEILGIIGRDPVRMAQDRIPVYVSSTARHVAGGGSVAAPKLRTIARMMREAPRKYRQESWNWVQHGERDEFYAQALAYEEFTERHLAQYAAPEIEVPELTLPQDLPARLAAELATSNRSRNEWREQAVRAEEEASRLDRGQQTLEGFLGAWDMAKADVRTQWIRVQEKMARQADLTGDVASEDVRALNDEYQKVKETMARVGPAYVTKLQAALTAMEQHADEKGNAREAAFASNLSTLVREIKAAYRAKEAERVATNSAFERMRVMTRKIVSPFPKTARVEQAKEWENFMALVSPEYKHIDRKAVQAEFDKDKFRAKIEQFYADNPDILTTKTRGERMKMFAKSLSLWSRDELEDLYYARLALEDKGKKAMAEQVAARERRIDAARRAVKAAVYREYADIDRRRKEAEARGDEAAKQALAEEMLAWETMRAQERADMGSADDKRGRGGELTSLVFTIGNVADILDGGKDFKGPNFGLLYTEPNAAENQVLTHRERRTGSMFEWVKENRIPVRRLFSRIAIDGVSRQYTVDALIDIYIGMKNERKARALTYGNRVDPKVIEFIRTSSDLEWARRLGDRILQDYEENKGRYFAAARDVLNVEPYDEVNYSPAMRAEVDQSDLDETVKFDLGQSVGARSAVVDRRSTFDRVDIPEEHQLPIKLGAWTSWLEQVTMQEQFIAYGQLIMDLKAIYHDQTVKSAIVYGKGKGYYNEIDNYINVLANRHWGRGFTWFDRLTNRIASNAAVAFMSYNLSTAFKQTPAIFNFLGHVRPDLLVKSAVMLPEMWKRAHEKSAQIRSRVERHEMIGIEQGRRKTAVGRWIWEIARWGMKPMELVDKGTTIIGWNAAYETALGRDMTEQAAIDYADWVVSQTQQASHPKDVAGAYRNPNALVRTLLMFTGPASKTFNQLTYGNYSAIQSAIRKGNLPAGVLKSFGITLGIGLSLLTFWIIGSGRWPQDDDDWEKALGAGAVELFPVVGPMVAAAWRGYNQQVAPMAQIIQSGSDMIARKDWESKMRSALEAVGLTTGIPVTEPTRVYRAFNDGNAWELIGWHKEK